jgi:CRP/FNR family cyclic AMP-dependent transcriptional regulator
MSDPVLARLREIPYFSGVSPVDLERLAVYAIKKTYPKNTVLINEGDEAGPLFILLKGKVRAFLSNASGRMVTLSTQESGSIFGELALLDGEPRSASVMTLEPAVCILIPRGAFQAWLREHPDAALSIIASLTKRIRVLTESVRGLALTDVYGRLVKALSGMAVADGGTWLIEPRPSHRDLANLVGCSREMISRIMKDLVRGQYVAAEGRRLRINRKLPESW